MNTKILKKMYERTYLIRKVEEKISEIYHTDKVKSPVHLSIGQEALSVGVSSALEKEDIVFGTYRGHALYLAKGGNLKKMIAELYGKKTGCCFGKGGSMHLADKSVNMMGTNAIVAASIPQAVGYAQALKMKNSQNIVVVFFGDGATEEGVYYESLNYASLMNLPILFICENNDYAIYTKWNKRVKTPNYLERAEAFGIRGLRINDSNIIDIYKATKSFKKDMHLLGPAFLELKTYRWMEHVGPNQDWHLGYRDISEIDFWVENDQLVYLRNLLNKSDVSQIESQSEKLIEEAFTFAEESDYPDNLDIYKHVIN